MKDKAGLNSVGLKHRVRKMVWDWAGLNFGPAAEELTERPSLELSELKSEEV